MTYAELHCHSNYSFQEGASSIDDLLARAAELGYPALALTDHDNMCGTMEFAQVARSLDINPIAGAEVTLQGGQHLTLLASDRAGYGNLCQLVSYSYIGAERRNPELDVDLLSKHSDGLVLLTGCRNGPVPSLAAQDRTDEAEGVLRQYVDWLGPDSVFVELQQNLVHGDTRRNRQLVELAGKVGVKVVATNNVHYHTPDRHRLQDALVAIRNNKSLEETHLERRPNTHFHLRSSAEMEALFRDCPEAVNNTLVVAERCSFDLTRDLAYKFPDYPVPPGHTPLSYLEELCHQAAIRRYGRINWRVRKRLSEEFRLIKKHDLAGFFLIYHDIIQIARDIQIELGLSDSEIPLEERPPGRGRGSSVAMLSGYLIGLSHIDPLKFDLSLERFLQEDMASVPDIDLDFPRNIREELIKRVHQHWGWDRAVLTGMISTYRMKGAIRDLGKALGLPFQDVDRLAKRVESGNAKQLQSEMERLPEFRDRTDTPVWRDLIDLAAELNGFPKYLAQHPGGMVIGSTSLTEIVPVQQSAIEDRFICHWDKDSVDAAGFVKIDFLALGALSQLQDALQLIEQRTGRYIDLSRIDFEDPAVYEMLHRADTIGVFQVESAAQIQTITRIKPRNLVDMAYEVAAVRPGVGANDGVTHFIHRRLGEPWDYDHPLERPALERTLGVILFQDQVNQVAIEVAGFGSLEADQLRRAFRRRNNTTLIDQYWVKFRDRSGERGVPEDVAAKIFKKFNGQYMFPESHAFAFGVTAFHMTWLKHYYPLEFFVGLFNQQPMGFYNLETLKEDARRHGVRVFNPDINASIEKCIIASRSPDPDGLTGQLDEGVLLGFQNVKGLGKAAAEAIVDARERGGPFADMADAMLRTGLQRETVERLVLAGGFDSLSSDRRSALWEVGLRYRPVPLGQGMTSGEAREGFKSLSHKSPRASQNVQNRDFDTSVRHDNPAALPTNRPCSRLLRRALKPSPTTEGEVQNVPMQSGFGADERSQSPEREILRTDGSVVRRETAKSISTTKGVLRGNGKSKPYAWQAPLDLPVDQDMAELEPMTSWERMAGEYQTMRLYPEGHLMAHVRPHLPAHVLPSDEMPHLKEGMEVWAAGLVVRRQRPQGKVVFITLEDEFGHIPLIVWPAVYVEYRLILREPVLLVRAKVSRREGTLNLVVEHAENLPSVKHTPKSMDFR